LVNERAADPANLGGTAGIILVPEWMRIIILNLNLKNTVGIFLRLKQEEVKLC